jgi:AcrR family transcriptional regulator
MEEKTSKTNRTESTTLVWLLSEPRTRKPRFSRDQITSAALHVADTEGFDAVTMKRIASELGSGTMTLYYYLRTKSDLVALMQDAILAENLLADDELTGEWRADVIAIARRTREVLLRHPWSMTALTDAQFGPNAMRHVEQSLAALDGIRSPAEMKLGWWAIIDAFVFGSALQAVEITTRARLAQQNPSWASDAVEYANRQLASGELPRLAALAEAQASATGRTSSQTPASEAGAADPLTDANDQFERGLAALVDGLVPGATA